MVFGLHSEQYYECRECDWFPKLGWMYIKNKGAAIKRLVEFPLEDGTSMFVEVDEPGPGNIVKASRYDVVEKAHETLEKSLERVKPAAQFILAQLRKLHDAPDEIEVSFGLKLSAECGIILAASGLEANYSVNLKWVKVKPKRKRKAG